VQAINIKELSAKLKSQGAVFEWIKPALPGDFYPKLFQKFQPGVGQRALRPGE